MLLPDLFHWAPTARRARIDERGLRPAQPTTTARAPLDHLCLGTDPRTAWAVSGGMEWTADVHGWDLWQVRLAGSDHVQIRPAFGATVEEVTVHNAIPADRCWRVGSRGPDHAGTVIDLVEALSTTVQYAGPDLLPAVKGWAWYDALTRHAPELAARLAAQPRSSRQTAVDGPLHWPCWLCAASLLEIAGEEPRPVRAAFTDAELLPHLHAAHPEFVVAGPGPYLSTACAFNLCAAFPDRCGGPQRARGETGPPARKYDDAPCTHHCHETGTDLIAAAVGGISGDDALAAATATRRPIRDNPQA